MIVANALGAIPAGDTFLFSQGRATGLGGWLSGVRPENRSHSRPSGQWLSTQVINHFPNLGGSERASYRPAFANTSARCGTREAWYLLV